MTRSRTYGVDPPFNAWVRNQRGLDSVIRGLVVTDIDMCFHQYRTHVDGIGTREVHLVMDVEVKTRDALPAPSQLETLWIRHERLTRGGIAMRHSQRGITSWHFGMFILSLPGEAPGDDDDHVRWCSFRNGGALRTRSITVGDLRRVLGFDLRPDTLKPLDLRRHHFTGEIAQEVETPLGFTTAEIVKVQS